MMGNPEKQWMMKWGTPISGNRHMIVTVTDAKSSKVTCGHRPFETNFGCSWHMLSLSASLQWFLLRICADGSGSVCIGNASQHSQVKCGLGASKHIQTMQKQTWLIMMLKKCPCKACFPENVNHQLAWQQPSQSFLHISSRRLAMPFCSPHKTMRWTFSQFPPPSGSIALRCVS